MHFVELKGICPAAVLFSDPTFASGVIAKRTFHAYSLLELLTHPTGNVEIQIGTIAGPGCFLGKEAASKRGFTDSFLSQLLLCYVRVSTDDKNPDARNDWACVGELKSKKVFSIPGSEKIKGYCNHWNSKWKNDGDEELVKKSFETSLAMLSPLDVIGEVNARSIVRFYGETTMQMRKMTENESTAATMRLEKRCTEFVMGMQKMFLTVGMGMLYGAMVLDESGGLVGKIDEDGVTKLTEKYKLDVFIGDKKEKSMVKYLKWALKELQKRGKQKNKETAMLIPYPDAKTYSALQTEYGLCVVLLMELLFMSQEAVLAGVNCVTPLAPLGVLLDDEDTDASTQNAQLGSSDFAEVISPLSPVTFTERLLPEDERRPYSKKLTSAEVKQHLIDAYNTELQRIVITDVCKKKEEVKPEKSNSGDAEVEQQSKKQKTVTQEVSQLKDQSTFSVNFRGVDAISRKSIIRAQIMKALKLKESHIDKLETEGCVSRDDVCPVLIKSISKFYRVYFSQQKFQEKSSGFDYDVKARKPPRSIVVISDEERNSGGGLYSDEIINKLKRAYGAQLMSELCTDTSQLPDELLHKISSDALSRFEHMRREWPDMGGPCLLQEPSVIEPGPMHRPFTQTMAECDDKRPPGGYVSIEDRQAITNAPEFDGSLNYTPYIYTGTRAFLNSNSLAVLVGTSNIENITLRTFPQTKGSKFGVRIQQRVGRGTPLSWTCHNRMLVHDRDIGNTNTKHEFYNEPPAGLYGQLERELNENAAGDDEDELGYYSA